jgi:hypothetical protein
MMAQLPDLEKLDQEHRVMPGPYDGMSDWETVENHNKHLDLYSETLEKVPQLNSQYQMAMKAFESIHTKATELLRAARKQLGYLTPLDFLAQNDKEVYFTTVFDIVIYFPKGSQELDSSLQSLVKRLLSLLGDNVPESIKVVVKECYQGRSISGS